MAQVVNRIWLVNRVDSYQLTNALSKFRNLFRKKMNKKFHRHGIKNNLSL